MNQKDVMRELVKIIEMQQGLINDLLRSFPEDFIITKQYEQSQHIVSKILCLTAAIVEN